MSEQNDQFFQLTVISPDKTIFEDRVKALSAWNEKGPFDILPMHTNFVSIIKGKLTIKTMDGKKNEIEIGNAILKAFENTVYVFVGLTYLASGDAVLGNSI